MLKYEPKTGMKIDIFFSKQVLTMQYQQLLITLLFAWLSKKGFMNICWKNVGTQVKVKNAIVISFLFQHN